MKLNEIPNSPNPGALPEMETADQAMAIFRRENDPFYKFSFIANCWLARLVVDAVAGLSHQNRKGNRSPQTGQAWRGFNKRFGQLTDPQFHYAARALHRFTKYSNPLPQLLLRAHAPLHIESQLRGQFRAHGPLPKEYSQIVLVMRQTAERLCDWVDATIHLETYGHCQLQRGQPHLPLSSQLAAFGYHMCKLPAVDQTMVAMGCKSESW